jgi:peroxiredoxin
MQLYLIEHALACAQADKIKNLKKKSTFIRRIPQLTRYVCSKHTRFYHLNAKTNKYMKITGPKMSNEQNY